MSGQVDTRVPISAESRDLLGRASRAIRNDWERETWDRKNRLYNVAVSALLIGIAVESDDINELAESVARVYLGEPA